jgi:POT family proton-dependent oligopeptide transporter
MIVFGVLGYLIPNNFLGSDTNDAFIIGCLPVIAFFIYLAATSEAKERRAIQALLAVFACVILFFAIFHQNGDALTTWAEDYTDREMSASIAPTADKFGMAQIVTNSDSLKLSKEEFKAEVESLKKKVTALPSSTKEQIVEKTKELTRIEQMEKSRTYFSNLPVERQPANGQSLRLYSTELYQSINPMWVVLLTPVMVGIWGYLNSRGKEPSTPAKIALGLFITALSSLVMVGAVMSTNNLGSKASSFWLFASYGVITLGELCLSPMGLSLVSKLSPTRITALMMGGYFLAISVGNKMSGMLSSLWETFEDKKNFFYLNFGLVMAAAVLMFLMLRWLNNVMKENNVK